MRHCLDKWTLNAHLLLFRFMLGFGEVSDYLGYNALSGRYRGDPSLRPALIAITHAITYTRDHMI